MTVNLAIFCQCFFEQYDNKALHDLFLLLSFLEYFFPIKNQTCSLNKMSVIKAFVKDKLAKRLL